MTWTWSNIQSIYFYCLEETYQIGTCSIFVSFLFSSHKGYPKIQFQSEIFIKIKPWILFHWHCFFLLVMVKSILLRFGTLMHVLSPNLFWSQTLSIRVSSSVVQGEKQRFFINACRSSSLGFMTGIYCLIINLGRTSGRKCCFQSFLYR